MSLNDMLAKNSPIGDKRKTSESEYLRLLGRNTELVDKIKWLERDKKELQDRIDKAVEYINENWGHWCSNHCKYATETINILKGGDKE